MSSDRCLYTACLGRKRREGKARRIHNISQKGRVIAHHPTVGPLFSQPTNYLCSATSPTQQKNNNRPEIVRHPRITPGPPVTAQAIATISKWC